MLAQDLGNPRHLARADKKIDFGKLPRKLVGIALRQTARDNQFLNFTLLFQARHFQDRVDRFGLSCIDKTASIDQHDVGGRGLFDEIKMIFLSSPAITSESTRLRAQPRLTMFILLLVKFTGPFPRYPRRSGSLIEELILTPVAFAHVGKTYRRQISGAVAHAHPEYI